MKNNSPPENPLNSLDFWLCEYAKRKLWLDYKDCVEDYERFYLANEAIMKAGQVIWKKVFGKNFSKKNYIEVIYLYAPRRATIKDLFSELSSEDILLLKELDRHIDVITSTSVHYGFLLCDLLFERHNNKIRSIETLEIYTEISKKDYDLNSIGSPPYTFNFHDSYFFTCFFPIRFPPDKKFFSKLHHGMQYSLQEDLVTLSLPQITDSGCNFEEFKKELDLYVTVLRYEQLMEEHTKVIEALTVKTLQLFLNDVIPEEHSSHLPMSLALDQDKCYSLSSSYCYKKKTCKDIFTSWCNDQNKNSKLDQNQCKQSKENKYRCTCCLTHEIKRLIRDKSGHLPVMAIMEDMEGAKMIQLNAKISEELETLSPTVKAFQDQLLFGKKQQKAKEVTIKNNLLGIFLWDLKNIHGVRATNLWSELLVHADAISLEGFDEKTEAWIKKITTTNVTHTHNCIKTMSIKSRK